MTASTEPLLYTLDPEHIEKYVTHGVCLGTVNCLQTIVEHLITVAVRLGVGSKVEKVVPCLEWLHLQ